MSLAGQVAHDYVDEVQHLVYRLARELQGIATRRRDPPALCRGSNRGAQADAIRWSGGGAQSRGHRRGVRAPVDRWYGSTVRLAWLLARDETTARRAAREAWLAVIAEDEVTPVAVLRATVERAGQHIAARAVEAVVDLERFEAADHRWAGWWTDAGAPQERERTAADLEVARALAGLDPR